MTWVENGILRNLAGGRTSPRATVNMSMVQDGSDLSIADMIKQTRRGLLVTFFWYIRGVPAERQPLLNTGMTRDGLFLIENGEIVGTGAELPVEHVAARRLQQPLAGRKAGADAHRRVVRRRRHGARAAGPHRGLLHDVGFTGGVDTAPRAAGPRLGRLELTGARGHPLEPRPATRTSETLMTSRRDFIKSVSAGAIVLASSDLIGDLHRAVAKGRVLESKFKGLADIALDECKTRRLLVLRHPLHAQPRIAGRERHRRERCRGGGSSRRRTSAGAAAAEVVAAVAGAAAAAVRPRRRRDRRPTCPTARRARPASASA